MATISLDDGQQMQGFGLLRGPGTGTSDSIPVAASDGEVIIPAEKVRSFGAAQILAMVDKGARGLPKPPVKNGRVHAAVGGLIEDPEKRNPSSTAGSMLTPQPTMATTGDIAGGAMPAPGLGIMAPTSAPSGPISSAAAASAPDRVQQLVNQIPTGGERAPLPDGSQGFGLNPALARGVSGLISEASAATLPQTGPGLPPPSATQAQVRRVDNAPANAAAIAAPVASPAVVEDQYPGVQPPAGPALGLLAGVTREGNSYSGTDVGAPGLGLARGNPLGGLADTQAQIANIQATQPTGGPSLGIFSDPDAQRRADFFTDAGQRNDLRRAQGLPSNSRARAAEIQAAQGAIDNTQAARTQTGLGLAREAGDTQRAQIQERGLDARARVADSRQAQSQQIDQARLGLDARRVALDANRDDRAAAASNVEQAKNARIAQLQEQVISGNPIQQRRAAEQLAALQGREMTGNQPPAGYRRKADGTLEFIPGGPADPSVRGSRAPLNDTQAKALQFGTRMQVSGELLDALASDAGGNVTQPGLIKRIADTFGAGAAANWTQSDKQQQVEQAQRDFINAVLRRESGAAISQGEFDNARKQYFPQPNDEPGAIELKRQNRLLATRGILAEVPDSETRVAQVRGTAAPAATAPAAEPAAAPGAGQRITSDADFAALPSGTIFTAPDGTTRRKP